MKGSTDSPDPGEVPHESVQAVLHRALAEEFEFTVIHNNSDTVLSENISPEEMQDLANIFVQKDITTAADIQKDTQQSGNGF